MTFTITCLNGDGEFEARRSTAKFHNDACRMAYKRKLLQKKDEQVKKFKAKADIPTTIHTNIYTPDTQFTPNWVEHGFKSKEDGMLYAISKLMEAGRRLKRLGLSDEIIVVWKRKSIRIA